MNRQHENKIEAEVGLSGVEKELGDKFLNHLWEEYKNDFQEEDLNELDIKKSWKELSEYLPKPEYPPYHFSPLISMSPPEEELSTFWTRAIQLSFVAAIVISVVIFRDQIPSDYVMRGDRTDLSFSVKLINENAIISNKSNEDAKLIIMNKDGMILLEQMIKDSTTTIDLSNLTEHDTIRFLLFGENTVVYDSTVVIQ